MESEKLQKYTEYLKLKNLNKNDDSEKRVKKFFIELQGKAKE